jgi:hypothetical protein
MRLSVLRKISLRRLCSSDTQHNSAAKSNIRYRDTRRTPRTTKAQAFRGLVRLPHLPGGVVLEIESVESMEGVVGVHVERVHTQVHGRDL